MSARKRSLPLSDAHRDILLHALGVQKRAGRWSVGGWRNHYHTDDGADVFADCEALAARGWMRGERHPLCGAFAWTFRVTEAGIVALRLAGWKIEVTP